jgi:hypothetical protein
MMAWGSNPTLECCKPAFAKAEAAFYGLALANSNFTGTAIGLAQRLSLVSERKGHELMKSFSGSFLEGVRICADGAQDKCKRSFFYR